MSYVGAADHPDPTSPSSLSPYRTSLQHQDQQDHAHSRPRAESSSSHNSNDPSGSTLLKPGDQTRARSSSSSKALLTMALLEAQSAVQLDNANEISAALAAYKKAVDLLGKVMEASTSPDEQERLKTIHDSYLFRIHLLSTPPTPIAAVGPSIPSPSRSPLPQLPPPSQPLPPTPRTPQQQQQQLQQQHSQDHLRPTTVASLTPASSTHAIATAMQSGYDSDSAPVPNAVTQGVAPPPRRVKKHIPVPLQSTNHGPVPPPTEPRTPRQRSDSTSAGDHVRHHARTNTGGSGHQTPAMHRARSREHLGLPIVGAPTAPLPPPPSTPPPIPGSVPGSATASPNVSTPSTPNMPNNQTFQASLSPPPPTSPPPRTPSHSANANFTSPPASPAHPTRRVSPLVPSGQQQQQQQSHQGRELVSSPPPPIRRSPLLYESSGLDDEEIDHTKFYDDDMADEDWLVKSPAGGPVGASDNHAPHPQRERASSKLTYTESQLEQIRSNIAHASISGQESAQAPISQQHQSMPAPPQVHHAPQHHRSFSQSSNLSTHQTQPQPSSQNSKSPLAGPMYSFQAGNGSISSLHALDNGTSHSKRISDSSRSLKEGSPLLRAATGAGNANGSTTNLSSTLAAPTAATSTSAGAATNTTTTTVSSAVSSPIPSPAPTPTFVPHPSPKPPMLHHQSSSSKLSNTFSNSSTASPTMDRSWSPNMSHVSASSFPMASSSSTTLFEVISDDPFAGLDFPLPPPFVEPPPADPYLRCFWLMRKLEQTMMTGGFMTKRMFVPRAIWYQSLVRLPAVESKTNACQTLTTAFNKMVNQSRNGSLNLFVEGSGTAEHEMERGTVIKELEALESIAHQVQIKLSKKLSFIHRPGKNLTISTNQGFTEELQGPVTGGGGGGATASIYGSASFDWQGNEEHPMPPPSAGLGGSAIGLKKAGVSVGGSTSSEPGAGGLKSQWKSFSKSVQKSIGNDKVEDSSSYTEVVLRLMQSSYFLESMLRHYSALSPALQTHIQIIKRLRRVCDVLHHVICAFVVRDLGELMGKYVKRVGSWVSE